MAARADLLEQTLRNSPGKQDYPRANHRWAHFEVAHEIARGNMGIVFRAKDTRTQRDVALKVLIVGRDDEESLERFKREARSLARLSHPGIVAVHSYGVQDGIPFITMDYVPGTTLQELLGDRGLSVARMADVIAQVARAVDHAHSRGVLHRDLKPANVLIGADGQARITDFGLARLSDSITLTNDGDLVGTPVFMSPEQIQGNIFAMGPSSDVWALGVMLYQALTGVLPFVGQTVEEVGRHVVHSDVVPPREVLSTIPEDLERIALAALTKDPQERYRTGQELARDLEAYMRGEQILAGQVTAGVRARRALRYLRLHTGVVGMAAAGALALTLVLGVAASSSAASAENTARELTTDAFLGRSAASHALLDAATAWEERRDPRLAWEQAHNTLKESRWAAAYLDRAARGKTLLQEALDRAPTDEEVAHGLRRDPALARLVSRAQALRCWALSTDPSLEPFDPAAELEAAYAVDPQLENLSALLVLAERRDDPDLARRAQSLLWQAGDPRQHPAGAELIRLRSWVGRLGAAPPCEVCGGEASPSRWICMICDHHCSVEAAACPRCGIDVAWAEQPSLRRAIRLAVACGQRLLGDPYTAWASLPPADGPASVEELVLRAALAREVGEAEAHLAALAALDTQARGRERIEAELERARELLRQGYPRAARDALAQLGRQDVSGPEARRIELWDAAAGVVLGGDAEAKTLRQISKDAGVPRVDRLRASRWLNLSATSDPAEPPGPDQLPPSRLARARLITLGLVPALTFRLGLRGLRQAGVDDELLQTLGSEADVGDKIAQLAAASIGLRDPSTLATLALLDPAHALRLEELSPPLRRSPPLRVLASPDRQTARSRRPLGLREGRLILERVIYLLERRGRASDALLQEAHERLRFARRDDPFDLEVRLTLVRLHLLRADATAARAQSARRSALLEAGAAVAIAPHDPRARSLLLQALWVNDTTLDLQAALADWDGSAFEPSEILAFARLREAYATGPGGLPDRTADDVLAQRLVLRLLRAAPRLGGSQAPPLVPIPALDSLPPLVLGLTGAEAGLREARLLLEEPAQIDRILLQPQPLLSPVEIEDLRAMLTAAHGDQPQGVHAGAAQAALLIQRIREHGSTTQTLKQQRRFREQARRHLEQLARRRPGLALAPLQAVVALWGGAGRAELGDLLAVAWPGDLYALLNAIRKRAPVPAEGQATELKQLEPLSRLEREPTSSLGSSDARGGE